MELSEGRFNHPVSPEEGSKEGREEGKVNLTLVASRNELKAGKLEIDSLRMCEKIPRNTVLLFTV